MTHSRAVAPLLLGLMVMLLAACAGGPQRPLVDDPARAWQQHRSQLQALEGWHLSGRIAVQAEARGWHARLQWLQEAEHYEVQLGGPLGRGGARLQGDPSGVWLENGETRTFAATPEGLLYHQTGWRLPVSGLRYWVLGLPAPEAAAQVVLDRHGQLAGLEQAGWRIAYERYAVTETGLPLPDRLTLRSDEVEVRLLIDRWGLATVEPPTAPIRRPPPRQVNDGG